MVEARQTEGGRDETIMIKCKGVYGKMQLKVQYFRDEGGCELEVMNDTERVRRVCRNDGREKGFSEGRSGGRSDCLAPNDTAYTRWSCHSGVW